MPTIDEIAGDVRDIGQRIEPVDLGVRERSSRSRT
jgi:hypothetical protein